MNPLLDTILMICAVSIAIAIILIVVVDWRRAMRGESTISDWWLNLYTKSPHVAVLLGFLLGFAIGAVSGFILGHLVWPQFIPN